MWIYSGRKTLTCISTRVAPLGPVSFEGPESRLSQRHSSTVSCRFCDAITLWFTTPGRDSTRCIICSPSIQKPVSQTNSRLGQPKVRRWDRKIWYGRATPQGSGLLRSPSVTESMIEMSLQRWSEGLYVFIYSDSRVGKLQMGIYLCVGDLRLAASKSLSGERIQV